MSFGSIVRVPHPSGADVLFNTQKHSYALSTGKALRSVSSVLNHFFPFDADRVSAIVAQRDKKTQQEILAQWKMSATLGHNVHAHIESIIKKTAPPTFTSVQGLEPRFLPVAERAAAAVLEHFEPIGVEKIVASPSLGVAGTIDFIGKHKKTGQIAVVDWKTTSAAMSNR